MSAFSLHSHILLVVCLYIIARDSPVHAIYTRHQVQRPSLNANPNCYACKHRGDST